MLPSIFEKITKRHIEEYNNNPNRLREDAENESAIVDDYKGRVILELLQNADDAQINFDSNSTIVGDAFIEFELTGKSLIVRNGGYPVNSDGIESLACMRLSPKDKKVTIGNKGIGFKSVLEITDQPIIHSSPFHFMFSEEHAHEILKETNLLDKLGKNSYYPIFRFPVKLSTEQEKEGNGQWATEILLPLRDCKAFEASQKMLEKITPEMLIFLHGLKRIEYKISGKETVCFLSEKDSGKYKELTDGEVKISDKSGKPTRYYRWVKMEPVPDNIRKELPKRWRDITHGQVAIAIPLESEDNKNRTEGNKVRVFFPTGEFSPVKMIIHGNFRTDSSRERILPETYNNWIADIGGVLLKEKVIHELQGKCAGDEGKILEYLEPRIKVGEMKEIERELWDSIFKHIKDYPFIKVAQSSKKVSPQQIYVLPESVKDSFRELFPQEYSIDNRYIPEDSFISTDSRIKALYALGAESLSPEKFIDCLDKVSNPEVIWSAKAISIIVKLIQSQPKRSNNIDYWKKLVLYCCSKKIFICSDGILRSLDINYPIFLPSEDTSDLPIPPHFIKFAFLEPKVIENLDKEGKEGFEELFLKQNKQENAVIYKFNKESILKKIILPWLKSNNPSTEQACKLRKFLFDLMKIDKIDWIEPWNEKGDSRMELCKLPVPIREGGETPAWQVYFGKEWTGDGSLERLYGSTKDRYFLMTPEKEWDEKDKGNWESFYRWLGVSWSPKVLPYFLPGKEKLDSKWEHNIFSFKWSEISKESWEQYCRWLNNAKKPCDDLFDSTPHMEDNRCLDGWEHISQDRELSKVAIKLLTKEIVESKNKAIIKYSSNRQEDYRNQNWQPLSFFSYSLMNLSWLPALDEKGETQQCALDLFMPDSQIDGEFSEIFPRLDIDAEPSERTRYFLREIGIRSEFRELNIEDWKRLAGYIKERFSNPQGDEIVEINKFYRKLLDEFPKDKEKVKEQQMKPPLSDVEVLASDGSQWAYKKREECLYMDKPEYQDIPLKDQWLFSLKLEKKEGKCKDIFGMKSLSDVLKEEPLLGCINIELTEQMVQWFEHRQPFILARLSFERPKSRDEDTNRLKKLNIKCVESLKVKYWIKDTEVNEREESAFLDSKQVVLYIDSNIIVSEPYNEAREFVSNLAKNIEYWLGTPHREAFRIILSCKDDGELIKELKDAHVSQDLIEDCKRRLEEEMKVKKISEDKKELPKEIKPMNGKEAKIDSDGHTTPIVVKPKDITTPTNKDKEIPTVKDVTPKYIGKELNRFIEANSGGGGSSGGGSGIEDINQKEVGNRGEEILIKELKRNYQSLGFRSAIEITHRSKDDPSSVYDIEVQEKGGKESIYYIEVKASKANKSTFSFEMSERQWKFAEDYKGKYQLWFVSDVLSKEPLISGPHDPLLLEERGELKKETKIETVYLCKVKLKV